jgi:hypothetical protein
LTRPLPNPSPSTTAPPLSEGEAVCCSHRRIQQSLLAAKLETPDTTSDKKLLTSDELKDIARQIKLLK